MLQRASLVVPILAIFAQLAGTISLGQMLAFAVVSLLAFYIGRILEGYAGTA
jgi:hypothetical protein